MKRFVAAIVVFLAAVAAGQEIKHAPTAEQCRAGQRLWLSQLKESDKTTTVSYHELANWFLEMYEQCSDIDPEFLNGYLDIEAEIVSRMQTRLHHFVIRHGLWEQFKAEDAEGKRSTRQS